MPQWEGIEDPSPIAAPIWLTRYSSSSSGSSSHHNNSPWKPLRKFDCQSLNHFLAREKQHEKDQQEKQKKKARTNSSDPVELVAAADDKQEVDGVAAPPPIVASEEEMQQQKLGAVLDEKEDHNKVYIEGGRAVAYPLSGRLQYTFVSGLPDREIDYATWFAVIDETKKKEEGLEPIFHKEDSDKIEDLYQRAIEASSSLGRGTASILSEEVVLSDESIVKVARSGSKLCMRRMPKGWFNRNSTVLQRGYGEYEVLGEDAEVALGPVLHLVFVIHGIGESMWSRDDIRLPSMLETINWTRQAIQEKQAANLKVNPQPPPGRIEFIPILWFDQLRNDSAAWVKSLRNCTLPTIPALRNLANDVILDVLLYMTPTFCEAVLECVTQQIHRAYKTFLEVHPYFDGKCSLIGHSLGSVIAWDLVSILKQAEENNTRGCQVGEGKGSYAAELNPSAQPGTWGPSLPKLMKQTIPFVPEATILLGSPLGMFLTLRGAHAAFEELRLEAGKQQQKDTEGAVMDAAPEPECTVDAISTVLAVMSELSDALPETPPVETYEPPAVSPFTMPTGSLYNIFHPSDPIAYRLEPLFLSPDSKPEDLPPCQYLTIPGKDIRLHLKARQFGDDLWKNFQVPKSTWTTLLTSVLARSGNDAAYTPLVFPLGGKSPRLDYALQPGVIDNEYVSAVTAHGCYFTNTDLHDFLISLFASNEKDSR